jgi:hypothetical protein
MFLKSIFAIKLDNLEVYLLLYATSIIPSQLIPYVAKIPK